MKWKKSIPWKKIISAVLGCCLALGQAISLAGCGESPVVPEEETIELIEPTVELSSNEIVRRRDLYTTKVYEVLVDPYIEDYSYEEWRNFLPTGRKVGDKVAAGDLIYRANIGSHSSQIEKLTEKLAEMEESYAEYYYDIRTKLNDQYWELSKLESELEDIQDEEPEQGSGYAYDAWSRQEFRAVGAYNKKELDINVNELALSERAELLRLDYDYYAEQLQKLWQQDEAGNLYSAINGQIIYLRMCDEGDGIPVGEVVASVADMNRKRLVCPAIDNATRYKTQEQYAFFNGEKYEVVYDEESSDATSSVFLLHDPKGEVPVGSYGNLVLYSDMRKQTLTVSREAVHSSGWDRYVYVLEDGKPVSRPVRIGKTSDVYVEILSGLEEGEEIFLDRSVPQFHNTAVVERGSASLTCSATGSLHYPICFDVTCEVKHGTVIFQGWPAYETFLGGKSYTFDNLTKARYVPMKAGDLIANIKVEPSDEEKLELEQLQNDLKRAEERLADLVKEAAHDYGEDLSEAVKKDIESRKEAIEQVKEQIDERVEAYGITAVYTERAGRLYVVQDGESFRVNSQSSVKVQPGDRLKSNYLYARMVDESVAYILLPNQMQDTYGRLGYNTTLTVSYNNWENKTVTRELPVLTANIGGSRQVLLLDREIVQDMNIYKTSYRSSSNVQTKLDVKGEVKCVDNVLLLPSKAITLVNGNFGYVNVLAEDGSIQVTGVVVGNKYLNGYCVLDGLTEGMTVCWE